MGSMIAQMSAAVGVAVLGASLAAAQNLVANGDFHSDVSGWTELAEVTLSWDGTSDYQNQPGSGSAEILNEGAGAANSGAIQCIDGIVGGQSYNLSAWLRAPTGQTGEGHATVFVWWYTEPGCSGTISSGPITPWLYTSDSWVEMDAGSGDAPLSVQSALVYLNIHKTSVTPGAYRVSYDHVVFERTGLIFADGFEEGGLMAWSVTVP